MRRVNVSTSVTVSKMGSKTDSGSTYTGTGTDTAALRPKASRLVSIFGTELVVPGDDDTVGDLFGFVGEKAEQDEAIDAAISSGAVMNFILEY
mmetsp:Transcript_26621/g.29833  ORF Transcript_26621/g.29833 Transcript_26621/m.29833 type:complete len:93 (-) Transcript_26621:104-382(-)